MENQLRIETANCGSSELYVNGKNIGDYDNDVGTLANDKHTSEYYWLDSAESSDCIPQ